MNHTEEEDPYLSELKDLPCTIFVTSRQKHLDGFTTFGIKAPQKSALSLIFRDNYNKILSREEKDRLGSFAGKGDFSASSDIEASWKSGGPTILVIGIIWKKSCRITGMMLQKSSDSLICTVGCTNWLILEKPEAAGKMFALLPYQEIDRNFTVMFFRDF